MSNAEKGGRGYSGLLVLVRIVVAVVGVCGQNFVGL